MPRKTSKKYIAISSLKPEALAYKFSELLRKDLSRKFMVFIVLRNREECSKDVCHSHDFCDANVVMGAAFQQLTGREFTGSNMPQAAFNVWNAAWDLAKKNEFYLTKV